ncbi:aldehyde dehydrogenase [Tenacibaculum sp. AHE15PA]|uniref:aldehyde dehydrogenase n=1 Tax=unclassified Tenacibaculum TaxID=2635139 RepID=UPI001C4E8F52|nr:MULTISPECIES: aldehyde dehydrogenase [unclassified Tenacibaculum]QXP73475.1 aldehyde dehydrogenase [Tenacibaculum sp. AHE14PA]QXP74989.1 aldehyde dehydrogenase [Tenacibaculum sp. AHE15PA]
MDISQLVKSQKNFFKTQQTKDISFRKNALKKLQKELIRREKDIVEALYNDFKKSEYEALMTETSIVLAELKMTIKNIHSWSKPKRVLPSLLNFPSSAKIHSEPYGTILIIAPWNYPYQLAFAPLIGAIAAGNNVVLKPSELTPHTSKVTKEIIEAVFNKNHVAVVEGGVAVSQELLAQRWDYIFFTGSVPVGKIVAKAAAEYLTPVTLELGGKSPCIVDETANIKLAAKRLVWGKFINGGQTCIAPDYLLIHTSVKEEFINHFKKEIINAYGENPEASKDYPRIVNTRNFDRLAALLQGEKIAIGGQINRDDNYIAPTVIDEPSLDSEVMKGEIFGPIFPLISYETEEEFDAIIAKYDKPLALYVFTTRNRFAKKIITKYSFGGGTINDTTVHFANHRLPFGGVGESGIGGYHGKKTFDTFSHKKGVVTRGNWLDVPTRYAPYKGKLKQLKFLMKIS